MLDDNTAISWCPVPTRKLSNRQCAVTIAPNSRLNSATPSTCYRPKDPAYASHPQAFIECLKNKKGDILSALPAIKYDLDGVVTSITKTFYLRTGSICIEGTAGLTGDLIIKPMRRTNNMTLSVNDLRTLNINAQAVRHDFIQSLKIKAYQPGSPAIFTLGTSLSDRVNMRSTSINVTVSPTSTRLSASFNPTRPIEVTNHSMGMTLELQMGYQFTGTATWRPNSPAPQPHASSTTRLLVDSGIIIATLVVTVLTGGTDLLLVGGTAAALSSQ